MVYLTRDLESRLWKVNDVKTRRDMVNDVKVIFGKGPGSQPVLKDANGHAPMWKKKSIFWELPC